MLILHSKSFIANRFPEACLEGGLLAASSSSSLGAQLNDFSSVSTAISAATPSMR